MNIQLPAVNGASSPWELMALPFGLMLVYQLVLCGFLYRILTRGDFDTGNRILWVLVVVLVPLFGCGLYLVAAPPLPDTVKRRVVPGSDVSGTRWAGNPGHTRDA